MRSKSKQQSEQAEADQPFDHHQYHGDAEYRRGQDLYPGGRIERPNEQW